MIQRLRKLLTSVPSMTVVGLLSAYLLVGFFVLPVALRWQLEKQFADRGYVLQMGDLRFDPLRLRLEVSELSLAEVTGTRLLAFDVLMIDLQWRSIVDRTWTIADSRLVAPKLHFVRAKDGSDNFSDLLDTFAPNPPEDSTKDKDLTLAPLQVDRFMLVKGQIEWLDLMLEQPLVSRVMPLQLELHGISTKDTRMGRYRFSARTAADASLELHGDIGIEARQARGQWTLSGLQIATLARGLNREIALQSPGGSIATQGGFDLSLAADGTLAGGARNLQLIVTDLFLQPPGSERPLLAAQNLSLRGGRLDLAQRTWQFDMLQLADASAHADIDAQGKGSWSGMLRHRGLADGTEARRRAPAGDRTASTTDASAEAAASWAVAIAEVRLDRLALALRDAAQQRSVTVAALELATAVDATIGGAARAGVQLPQLRATIKGLALQQGQFSANVPSTQLEIGAIKAQVGSARLASLDAVKLTLAQGFSVGRAAQSASTKSSTWTLAGIRARSNDNGSRIELDSPQGQVRTLQVRAQGQSADIAQLGVDGGKLVLDTGPSVNGGAGTTTLVLDTLESQLQDLRLQAEGQSMSLSSMTFDNGQLTLQQGGAGTQLQAETPVLQLDGIAVWRGADRAELADFKLQAARIDASTSSAGNTELGFSGMRVSGSKLSLARDADMLELASLALGGDTIDLVMDTETARFSGTDVTAELSGAQATQSGNRLELGQARWRARTVEGRHELASGVQRTNARIADAALSLTSLALNRIAEKSAIARAVGTDATDLATLASATGSAEDLALEMTDAPLQLRATAIALQLQQAVLHDPARPDTPLVQLGDVRLVGADVSLTERDVSADALHVDDARASVWLDDQGRLHLLDLLDAPDTTASAGPDHSKTAAVAAPPWRVAVKTITLQDATARLEDRRREPPLALGLNAITLNLTGFDTAAGAPPMQVALGTRLDSGGEVKAEGSAALDPLTLDLQLSASGLDLAPVQPVLSEYVMLTMASGTASTQGRLTYGPVAGIPSQLSYTGGLSVEQFLLEENDPPRAFLAWESMKIDDLILTLEPNRVDIGEVRLGKPVGRLLIAEDQSINLTDILIKRDGEPPATPVSAAVVDDSPADNVFPITVARIRLDDGELEFADLSLRPQFGTRMHELKGVITGVGNDANRSAQVQLDARVDQFGSARIRGQVSLLQPERLTDIEMVFRNLDMTALSPYAMKFAGYRIAAGRLSLDLQYKVRQGKLMGENKVVLRKVELGKKVDSPDALDLPLELALAVLEDSNGVIDIALPVRGDLDDPQFDFGAVIRQAIGKLIGDIVTAPFRALAALFGGSDDKDIDTINFEPGTATLAPPEQQKIQTVARALRERPNLALTVAPTMAPQQDKPVLQSLAVRREIAKRMGLELMPDEDPGPIDAANPRVPAAVKAAFGSRYAPAVFDLLRQRAVQPAAAGAAELATEAAQPSPPSAAARPAAASTPPPDFYQGLIQRMITEQPVTDAMLAQLGRKRAQAIVEVITGEDGGVPATRVKTGALRNSTNASAGTIPLTLELEVAP